MSSIKYNHVPRIFFFLELEKDTKVSMELRNIQKHSKELLFSSFLRATLRDDVTYVRLCLAILAYYHPKNESDDKKTIL